MFGRGAATSADDAHAVILYEMFVIVGQVFRRELVHRVAADVLRESGIRQNRNVLGGIQAQIADRLIHLRRTGGAVQADHVDVVRLKRGQRRANFGAEQHGSGFLQRYLNLHRQPLPRLAHCLDHGDRGNLRLQQILAGLDQQHIDAAFDQRQRLLFIGRQHRVPTDVSERRQFCGWPHRSGDEARFVLGRKLLRHFAGELRRLHVDLANFVAQIELAENQARPAERVGLDDVASHAEKVRVNVASRFRGLMIPQSRWPIALRQFKEKWTQYKRALCLLDFTDLIETLPTGMSIPAPRPPAVIFADEAQDLNPMQLTLIRKWGERANYFILAATTTRPSFHSRAHPRTPSSTRIFRTTTRSS